MLLCCPAWLWAQEKAGPPPALVSVDGVSVGAVAPRTAWIGTVKYFKAAEIAAEISGKVIRRNFEEGKRVSRDMVLLEIDASLHRQELAAQEALLRQASAELERASLNFKRIEALFQKQTVPEQVYDENRLEVRILENKVAFHAAEVERLAIELAKRSVRAPFDGVVLEKKVEVGEWLSAGAPVCILADDREVEVVAMVPGAVLNNLSPGDLVQVQAGNQELAGILFAVIAKGDVMTRTFPVKVRVKNSGGLLLDGLEARVHLPSGPVQESLMVHRDAVLGRNGTQVVFAVQDNIARMVEVEVVGYQGLYAGVRAEGLSSESRVVIKGNERLQDGQAVLLSN